MKEKETSLIKRFLDIVSAMFAEKVVEMENDNPTALLNKEKEKRLKMIKDFDSGLVEAVSYCQELIEEILNSEKEQSKIETMIQAHLAEGNEAIAAKYALELESIEERKLDCNNRLTESKKTYDEMVVNRSRLIRESEITLKETQYAISEAKMWDAQASLIEMTKGTTGDGGESVAKLKAMAAEKRRNAKSRMIVANLPTGTTSDPSIVKIEQNALGMKALEKFKSKKGLNNELPAPKESSAEYVTELS